MSTHNGWRNYATWRVKLEIFDDEYSIIEVLTYGVDDIDEAVDMLADEALQAYADDVIFGQIDASPNSFIVAYANAFLEDVDWYQISEALVETLTDNPGDFGLEGDDDE